MQSLLKHLYRFLRAPYPKVLLINTAIQIHVTISSITNIAFTSNRPYLDNPLICWQNRNLLSLSLFESCCNVCISWGFSLRPSECSLHTHDLFLPQLPVSLHLEMAFLELFRSKWQIFLQILHVSSVLNDPCLDYVWCHLVSMNTLLTVLMFIFRLYSLQMLCRLWLKIYLSSAVQQCL